MFGGWDEYPPTNLLLKAIASGLGVLPKYQVKPENKVPPEVEQQAFDAMQRAAIHDIAIKAGSRLPILQGKDPDLPKTAPIFDIDEMRKRNAEVARRRAERRIQKDVG